MNSSVVQMQTLETGLMGQICRAGLQVYSGSRYIKGLSENREETVQTANSLPGAADTIGQEVSDVVPRQETHATFPLLSDCI